MADGRKTNCDRCDKLRPDCIWVKRMDSGREYVLCSGCRNYWRLAGIEIVNADPDYKLAV